MYQALLHHTRSYTLQAPLEVPPDPSQPEQPVPEQAAEDDVDIVATGVTDIQPTQPSSTGEASDGPEAVTPTPEAAAAPPEAAAGATDAEQPPSSRGRGSRGRKGGRGGRGRGRSKARGKARTSAKSSPRAPSEQDQAEFADQLDSPSRNNAELDEVAAQPAQSDDVDVSISDTTDQQQASELEKGDSVRRDRSELSHALEQLTSAKSRGSRAAESHASAAGESNMLDKHKPAASDIDAAKNSAKEAAQEGVKGVVKAVADQAADEAIEGPAKEAANKSKSDMKTARAGANLRRTSPEDREVEDPPAKRPRRSTSGISQSAEMNKGTNTRRPQAKRGVVQESDSNDDTQDINIVGERFVYSFF